MNTSIISHYSDFQPSFNYKFFEVRNAIHTSSQIPVTIWTFNISEFVKNHQDYAIDKIKNAVEKLWVNLNALKRISHPNLLRIYETTDEDSEPGIISFSSEQVKYCLDGSFFKGSANTISSFSKDESLFIASQLSDGLSYLHDQLNVASFGICPENIFITPNFDIKIGTLIHFAKFSEPLSVIEPSLYPSQCSIFDIDKRFLSPELKTHNNITSKVDVFMFGITILYCYEGEGFLNEMASSQSSESAFLSDFLNGPKSTNTPEDMKLILSKCLSDDPSERPTFQQLSDSDALTQLLIKALNFLDSIETKPIASHKSFYKGLAGIIDQFSERILLLKIIPILVEDACTNSDDESLLLDHILPILLTASLKISAKEIDAKIVKRLFDYEACQSFFLENCRNFLTNEDENNDVNKRIPLIGVVILNSYRDENTKERGAYLMKMLFEQFANLDQDDFKETILKPLFRSSDCAIMFLFYIQTIEEEDEDKSFKNLAVLIISYAIEISNDENYEDKSSRLDQKVLELIPTFLKYGKEMKVKTFESLVLDPVLSNPETLDILVDNLDIFDDPVFLIQIALRMKEKNISSYRQVFPILMPKVENMEFNDFDEKVFKPFVDADPLCIYSMIENIEIIKKIESKSPQKDSDEAKLTIIQSIILKSYKHKEEVIREKVPERIPLLYSSISKHQKQKPDFLKESIFMPFYENFSSNESPYQEQIVLELIKHSSKSTPIVDIIVDLTFENCKSNETIMNEISSLIPSYIRNAKNIKLEAIQYLIDTNKYDSRISDIVVSKIAAINDVNTKLFILKYALDNPTESTHYATLAWIFLTAANSTEFSQKYSSSKFSEIQTEFVGPLFRVLDSADYLIQNFDSFDHQYATSKKIQMLIVTEISNLVNENPELSALADGIPMLLEKCAIDTSESVASLKGIAKSFSYKEPIDIAYISAVLDSLNKQTSEELAPECSKQLRALYNKIKKVKNDETNKVMIINKIAIVLANLPPFSRKTTKGISLAIELVENKLTESSKREHLLDFIDQTVAAIRAVKDYQPSDSESEDDDDNSDDDTDDNDNSKKQQQQLPMSPQSPQPEAKKEKVFDPFESSDNQAVQDPFSSNENNSSQKFNDPFANSNGSADSNAPAKDPFNAASTSNDPFKPTNSNVSDPFKQTQNIEDPFKKSPNAEDPFKAQAKVDDPFKTASNVEDPFKASTTIDDPFKTASNVEDPFKAGSSTNDPFKTTPNVSDPFKTPPNVSDPFKTDNNPFKTTPSSNDPFNTASSSNDPFKASSHQDASQDDPPSSQSSSANTQLPSSLSQFPSLQTNNSSTKSVKIDVKKDKKKEKEREKEKEKEKKKKEKLEKKQKAKDKKIKDKERRKSRNDLPVDSSISHSPTFQEPESKMIKNDPNTALKKRSMSRPVVNTGMTNPFSTPSNSVDPFKQMESNQPNHFESQNNNAAGNSSNPFSSSATNNNPFNASQSTNNNTFGSQGLTNPFASAQKSAPPPAQNASNNDPFAQQQQEDDSDDDSDDDDDSNHHHHHHHHHGKSNNESEDNEMVPEKRENRLPSIKRNTETRQSFQPSMSKSQGENVFKQSYQRTPSFDIFGRAQTVNQSSQFESESKATSDAKIDFNNDELDFDSD